MPDVRGFVRMLLEYSWPIWNKKKKKITVCVFLYTEFKSAIRYFSYRVNSEINYDFFRHPHCYFILLSPSSICISQPIFFIFLFRSLVLGCSSLCCFSHSQPYPFSLCRWVQSLQVMCLHPKIWS